MEKFFESIKGVLPYIGVSLVSIILTVVIMILVLGGSSKTVVGTDDLGVLGLTKIKPSSYVVKINDYYLSTDEFNKQYKSLVEASSGGDKSKIDLYMNDLSTKKQFLENTINELAIAVQAYNEGYLSSQEWATLYHITLRKAVVDGFLAKKIDLSSIEVTDKEIEDIYQKQKELFKQNNIPPDKAEEYIRTQLKNQKLNQKISEFLQKVRDKMVIDKIEDNVK
jgi:hypothetical protein